MNQASSPEYRRELAAETDVERVAVFSVDVELPFAGSEDGPLRFLDLLEHLRIPATMFVVGEVAEAHPGIVDAIHAAGHEIACHGWRHPNIGDAPGRRPPFVDELSDEELDAHCRRSTAALTRGGVPPAGFRAPWFRIARRNLAVVARHFSYDSSFSVRRGGGEGMPAGLAEFPVSSIGVRGPLLGSSFMFGFGVMRIIPSVIGLARPRTPLMLYSHSFDLTECPAGLNTSALKRLWYFDRCGPARARDFTALVKALRDDQGFRFRRCCDLLPA